MFDKSNPEKKLDEWVVFNLLTIAGKCHHNTLWVAEVAFIMYSMNFIISVLINHLRNEIMLQNV